MKKLIYFLIFLFPAIFCHAQDKSLNISVFNNQIQFEKRGRGTCEIKENALITKNASAVFGDSSWSNYEVTFSATTPFSEKEVQIWSAFRVKNRDDKYIVCLKGGIENDLYLARLGYMGTDDYLALRHIEFPLKTNQQYKIKIQVVNQRIRIFLNDEKLPRIDITDKNENLSSGRIELGGGWLETYYQSLSIKPLIDNALDNLANEEYTVTSIDKEKLRREQRSNYQPIEIKNIQSTRTEISLNGNWLFEPGYEADDKKAPLPDEKDDNWHIMHVPDFWNPDRVWLYGEKYGDVSKGVSDSYCEKEIERCESYTFDYKKTNVGWYRQWIELPSTITGKHTELNFDAVSKVAEVWVNGKKAANHTGMFGAFKADISSLLHAGKNLIAVKVYRDYIKNIQNENKIVGVAVSVEVTQKMLKDLPHGMFVDDPAGIWQPVSLIITDPLYIKDVFIKPNLQGADLELTVKNASTVKKIFDVHTKINGVNKSEDLFNGNNLSNQSIEPGEEKTLYYSVNNLHPDLWTPETPNLYNFDFSLINNNNSKVLDVKTICSGFKTFIVKNGFFYLNGNKYWLRGANQTAMPLAPNDSALADKFSRLMHDGNIAVTRTHTVPYTETWMNAADKYGIGISYEGGWPWLMLDDSPIPDKKLLDIWANEFEDLIKKYRNHPSLFIWAINNEMKFYNGDHDIDRAKEKMRIISDVVKHIRKIDSTHPICFDSNYSRWSPEKRFGKAFMDSIDDGDMDDIHQYTNWYNDDIFDEFNGRFQHKFKYPNRPLISEEMSTGYPDETGHPVRFYTLVHQTPSSLVGKYAYSYSDPKYFVTSHSFISKELAEVLRRKNPEAAGILHFSLSTWFSKVYDKDNIQPQRAYYEMKKALQPVLVSAELWGRHFYAGDTISTSIYVVNDNAYGKDIPASSLKWKLIDSNGKIFAEGDTSLSAIKYYERKSFKLSVKIPEMLPASRTDGKLVLELYDKEKKILLSENDYELLFANKDWVIKDSKIDNISLLDKSNPLVDELNFLNVNFKNVKTVSEAIDKGGLIVLSDIKRADLSNNDVSDLLEYVNKGGKLLITGKSDIASVLFPESVRGIVSANPSIVNLEIPESPVFKDIQPLDIRYFNNKKNESPNVCIGAYQIIRNNDIEALASSVKVHGYLSGSTEERSQTLDKIKGFPIVKIKHGKGEAIVSALTLEKSTTDPVAGKLLINILSMLSK